MSTTSRSAPTSRASTSAASVLPVPGGPGEQHPDAARAGAAGEKAPVVQHQALVLRAGRPPRAAGRAGPGAGPALPSPTLGLTSRAPAVVAIPARARRLPATSAAFSVPSPVRASVRTSRAAIAAAAGSTAWREANAVRVLGELGQRLAPHPPSRERVERRHGHGEQRPAGRRGGRPGPSADDDRPGMGAAVIQRRRIGPLGVRDAEQRNLRACQGVGQRQRQQLGTEQRERDRRASGVRRQRRRAVERDVLVVGADHDGHRHPRGQRPRRTPRRRRLQPLLEAGREQWEFQAPHAHGPRVRAPQRGPQRVAEQQRTLEEGQRAGHGEGRRGDGTAALEQAPQLAPLGGEVAEQARGQPDARMRVAEHAQAPEQRGEGLVRVRQAGQHEQVTLDRCEPERRDEGVQRVGRLRGVVGQLDLDPQVGGDGPQTGHERDRGGGNGHA